MIELGEYKEQEFTAHVPDYSAVEWRMENEDEEVCLPREGVCVNGDSEDCFDCQDYWLDFHADSED